MRKLKAERRRERVIIYTTTTTIPCDAARMRTALPTSVDPSHLLCFFAIKATRKSARKTLPELLGVKVIKYNMHIYV